MVSMPSESKSDSRIKTRSLYVIVTAWNNSAGNVWPLDDLRLVEFDKFSSHAGYWKKIGCLLWPWRSNINNRIASEIQTRIAHRLTSLPPYYKEIKAVVYQQREEKEEMPLMSKLCPERTSFHPPEKGQPCICMKIKRHRGKHKCYCGHQWRRKKKWGVFRNQASSKTVNRQRNWTPVPVPSRTVRE